MLYRIKSNLDVNGHNWGMDFVHGEAFTEREDVALRLKSLGYVVEEVPQHAAKTSPAPVKAETPVQEVPTAGAAETPLETPPAEEGKLTCPVCGKVCGNQAVLTRHMNKDHK